MFTTPEGFKIALPGRRQFGTIANVVAALVALLAGLYAAGEWSVWLAWRHGVPFGQADPLLGRDVAFYVFTLPFLEFVRSLLQLGDRHRGDRVRRGLLSLRQPRLDLPCQAVAEPHGAPASRAACRRVSARCWRSAPGCARPSI